ncbi:YheC/YheD family protein [Alkalicella caledoniensis]|uniref:YheC/YheD family protein n=1 Tax=Alkalicella caledoniensis TaxID=2731377 RepID=A0A7G9W6V9_ALKCA|nr:YheC/YheD family protein [Alkalicella caledoniensis]QNO14421.1 YheC/YheD family protein [Alkalicella caledoniensis]
MRNKNVRAKSLASKLSKYKILLQSDFIRPHLLETIEFTEESLLRMIEKYSFIYIKPVSGSFGRDILSLEIAKEPNTHYVVRNDDKILWKGNFKESVYIINAYIARRKFLIQQGIRPFEYKGKHVDIRVFIQKPDKLWIVSGLGVKVAKSKNMIVTNYNQGASILSLKDYLSSGNFQHDFIKINHVLEELCLEGGEVLNSYYPRFRELGFDVILDEYLKPWIIEVNTKPKYEMFREIDVQLYKKIDRYHEDILRQYKKEKASFKKVDKIYSPFNGKRID